MTEAIRSEEPIDRLTNLGDRILEFLATSDQHLDGDKIIVMIHGADGTGGMALLGFEHDSDAILDIREFLYRLATVAGS
jgi:hypothetical protein